MLSYCLASRENKKFMKDESLKLNPFVTTNDIVTQAICFQANTRKIKIIIIIMKK